VGYRRPHVDLFNVIACKPPGASSGAWLRMTKHLERLNKQQLKAGKKPYPHPEECCRPRLLNELTEYVNILTLGKVATKALTHRQEGIQKLRGGPLGVDVDWCWTQDPERIERRVFPILHPSFGLRAPAWKPVIRLDVGKAMRWFRNELRWTKPDVLWRPEPGELKEWLEQPAPFWAYDVETAGRDGWTGIEAMRCTLRTIAIAIPDMGEGGKVAKPEEGRPVVQKARAVGITLRYTDGRPYYDPETEREIIWLLQQAFIDGRLWVGHNAGYYDRMVIEDHLGVTPAPLFDTLFPTRTRAPDLPKGLKTIGSLLTDVDRWETNEKGDSIATGVTNNDELLRYNIIDATVNVRIVAPLVRVAHERGAYRPLPDWVEAKGEEGQALNLDAVDHMTQDMCVNLHKQGLYIDQKMRFELEAQYELSVRRRRAKLLDMAQGLGATWFANPGSGDQIRDLFFGTWDLGIPEGLDPRDFYTETGLPSTGDKVLRALLAGGRVEGDRATFIRELRLFRREANKVLGTLLIPMRMRRLDGKRGLVWDDGRVRSTWNAHTTSVGRLSSSGPNVQNVARKAGLGKLKRIFSAAPGNILIGADLDQAHLRIIANYWQIPVLVQGFMDGLDPHNALALALFKDRFVQADGWAEGFTLKSKPAGGAAVAMRDVTKTFRYASIYAADAKTIHQVLTSTEQEEGKLPYLGMRLREVELFRRRWMRAEPEWQKAWKAMDKLYQRQGWLEEPVMHRRSGGLSEGKLNEVVNYPILAAEASLMRLAEHRVIGAFPFEEHGPGTGMVHQCHDSIAVEVPLPKGFPPDWAPKKGEELPPELERKRCMLEECMTINLPGWNVVVSAEAAVGRTLKDI